MSSAVRGSRCTARSKHYTLEPGGKVFDEVDGGHPTLWRRGSLEPTTSTGKQFVSLETVAITTPWTTVFLVVIIVVLLIVIVVLLKIMHVMHLRPEAARDAMDWVRMQWRQNRVRRLIRDVEQAQLGVYLEDASSEHGNEGEF